MEEKTYKINEVEFRLNTDPDVDEGAELANLMQKLRVQGMGIITGNFTGDEVARFLQLVLIPVKGPLPADFFRKTKESVQLDVFKDFFLDRLRKMRIIKEDYKSSIEQQNQLSEDLKV